MNNFLFLRFLDRIRFVFTALGIDYPTMRQILQLKLVMNGRRNSSILNQGISERKNSFLTALALYAFLGLFIGMFILFDYPMFLKMNIVLGMIIFILITTMISDFSTVLLDVQEKNIILIRPVHAKTFNAAKLLYILYYLFCITVSIAGASLIASLYKHGFLFFLTMLVMLFFICSLTLLFTAILYFIILHLFSGEKLRQIINYFQIALSIFMTVSFQIIGRMFDFIDMNFTISIYWWSFLLPSSWFAAPFSIFFMHERGLNYILLALIGVIIPVIALILYIKVAAPAFERNLQKLTSDSGEKEKVKRYSIMRRVSCLICNNREERVFFRFTCSMLKSERKLKLRLLPNLTLAVIMPIVMLFSIINRSDSISEALYIIASGKYYLSMYISLMFFSTIFESIKMSENYLGSWIYRAMPVEIPGRVIKGALKAFIYKYVMIFYLLTCLIYVFIYGVKIFPDLILIFINMIIIMVLTFQFSIKELPFSKELNSSQGSKNIGLVFLSMLLCGGLGGVHYIFIVNIPYGLLINLGISLLLLVILWHTSFRVSWENVIRDAK